MVNIYHPIRWGRIIFLWYNVSTKTITSHVGVPGFGTLHGVVPE